MLNESPLEACDLILSRLQCEFPRELRARSLYYVGSAPERDRFHLGIVGSRRPSPESREIIDRLFARIADLPIRIISGGALGVDAQAHACAMNLGLPTYSWVVGDPSAATPHTNRGLFHRIAQQPDSAIITPSCLYCPRNIELQPYFWLERNAWIAANSDLLVVIQAKEKSGTWSTVRVCQDIGVPVYAVTGSPVDPCYSGNALMISMSYAHPLAHIDEFAEDLRAHLKNSVLATEKNVKGQGNAEEA